MENGRVKSHQFRNRPNGKRTNNFQKNNNRNNDRESAAAGPSGVKRQNERFVHKCEERKPIGFKTLETVLKIDGDAELILKLSSEKNGFLLLLDQNNIRPDLMCLILAALARASETTTEQETVQLLVHFFMKIIPKLNSNANFHRELVVYSANLRSHLAVQSSHRQKHIDAIQNFLTFLRRLQLTLYLNSFDAVQDLVHQFASQIEYINRKGNELNELIVELLAQLKASMENFDQMKEKTAKTEVLLAPPEDFRSIPIYPDTYDILSNHEPFIRENVVEGKYVGGVDHYLDTQFRLLREDFVRPLRNGITEYVRIKNNAEAMKAAKFRIRDLNVYRNVQIVGSKMVHDEQVHLCVFDCSPFRHLRWQYNKRMMNGSLVCLSPDDFKTFFFATVTGQREPEKLARGEFQIRLEIECSAMPEITSLIKYVMVESQVYFEAYRHNLKVLQEFGKDNFPLEKYIVDVNKNIAPPTYLSKDTVYRISNGLPNDHPEAKISSVKILSNHEWPPRTDFNLDESQYLAFQAALTKQIVVIQGPPGTGKTYLGLRIVETLLANAPLRSRFAPILSLSVPERPILVVCYTNHALDQFLEGIQQFCKENELVRIGGKSQCEALQKFNLSNIRSVMKAQKQVPEYIHHARYESISQLKSIQEEITRSEQKIDGLNKKLLGDELQLVIMTCNQQHLHQLMYLANGRNLADGILNWLGYGVNKKLDQNNAGDTDQRVYAVAEAELDGEVVQETEMDEEEINEIERSRLIDMDSDASDADEEFENKQTTETEIDHYQMENNQPIDLNNIVPIEIEDDGFQQVRNNRNSVKRQFKYEMYKTGIMSREQAAAVGNINALMPNDRWDLYRLWTKLYVQELETHIKVQRDDYRNECLRFNGLRKQEDIEIVKQAKIIGMTTTGAAKYRHIIEGAKPKITIVEEAAEVLEAHIVTALCNKTDHLILIGDHLQLRPNPAVYELAKKFNLEISLFERLIKNQMEYFQLKQQHRMRPCISSLLVPHIYKQLIDHPSVKGYEDVKGIAKNMYFINHGQNESSLQDTRSHMNMHEASFIVELCRYVVLQGYDTSQVTILTTYSGQLHQIRQLIRGQHLLSGVRAAVVDNYQGEENDIILLSFVRSNDEANIGFLKTANRVNVALSRARKGLYCIGNFDCLAEKSQLWKDLLQNLAAQEAIGDALSIFCQNHTEFKTLVKSKEDFAAMPDGGCSRPCTFRLLCGHSCPSVCHVIDMEHVGVYQKCPKKCDKIVCESEHRCRKHCHVDEECGKCTVQVQKVRPQCEHTVSVSCSTDPEEAYCRSPCAKDRSCGHKCKGLCSESCDETICVEIVELKAPCGHSVKVKCSEASEDSILLNACTEPCNAELKCGHLCKGSCGRCKYGRLHISCKEKCNRTLVCGHPCPDLCSIDCAPCKKKCMNSCVHSKCPLPCGDPCAPCMEKCKWNCRHLKCSKLCSEPCDRQLCEHPSTVKLRKCKHRSIGVCGEKTPRLCRICNKDEVEEIFFGNEDDEGARFIELDDCKHVIEVNGLIQWMKSEPDSATSNAEANNPNSIQFKKCPKCKTVIRHTKALNTFIQASLRDIQQVKLKTFGNPKENKIMQRNLNRKASEILDKKLFRTKTVQLSKIYAEIFHKTVLHEIKPGIWALPKPKHMLIELSNKFDLVEKLKEICLSFDKGYKYPNNRDNTRNLRIGNGLGQLPRLSQKIVTILPNIPAKAIAKFEARIQMAADFIKDYRNCDQKREDIANEISFLQMMSEAIVKASVQYFNEAGKKLLTEAFEFAHKYGSATETVRKEFARLVTEACKASSGLGISLEEKQMVLRAMGFGQGHWYKCPNGHVYCIADCGGAVVTSRCPDCKAVIGGTNHSLDPSNALATEMDGATSSAWPTNLQAQLRPFMD